MQWWQVVHGLTPVRAELRFHPRTGAAGCLAKHCVPIPRDGQACTTGSAPGEWRSAHELGA